MIVTYQPNWTTDVGRFEFRSPDEPPRRIPVSETGYRSHFASMSRHPPVRRTTPGKWRSRCCASSKASRGRKKAISLRCFDRRLPLPVSGRGICASGRKVAPREDGADVAQIDERRRALRRSFAEGRQGGGDLGRETAKLGSSHAHQFVQCQHLHCFLHRFDRANRGLLTEAQPRRRRVHRLRPERRGGVRSTCSHAAGERC